MEQLKNVKSFLKNATVIIALMHFGTVIAQMDYKIEGLITDINKQPIIYSSVVLYSAADSLIIAGTISDDYGNFELSNNKLGSYFITVSFLGYETETRKLEVRNYSSINLGKLTLQSKDMQLDEVIVLGERLKAKQQLNSTIYYVNKKMQKASNTGIDLIKYVPGIQVDMFQNISIEGKQNSIIQVNGIERDASFLSQLNSNDIDKIEINNNPGVKYRAGVSGIINIILKESENKGISGHFYAEVPTNFNEIYSFPSASVNYTFKKVNIFASYNGEYSYFDIEAENIKSVLTQNNPSEIIKTQGIQQKNWSHKFHFGMDYFLNKKNQLNFYGFINPYSNEHDGIVSIKEMNENSVVNSFHYNKDDDDKSLSAYASVFYKHIFSNPKTALIFDMNYHHLQTQNSTAFSDNSNTIWQISYSEPYQNSLDAHLNFSFPLSTHINMETGFKQRLNFLGDHTYSKFNYTEKVSAVYTLMDYKANKFQINGGLRMEFANLEDDEALDKTIISALPNFNVKYDLSKESNLKLAYQKWIIRPIIYQLNPNLYTIDPYTTQKGNSNLSPLISHNLSIDYATTIKNSFISAGVFYTHSLNIIEDITALSDTLHFENETQNSGKISHIGVKTLGSLKLHKNITVNPLVKIYHIQTRGSEIAKMNSIDNKSIFALESGLSMAFLLKHDVALSASFKYNSPLAKIQHDYAEDALYFISLQKTFFENLSINITSAIPFKKEFTYQRYDSKGYNFKETSEENIKMSALPIWFKLKYSFASGKKVNPINRTNNFKENKVKKGF